MFGHETVCSVNEQENRFVNVLEPFHFSSIWRAQDE